MEIPLNYENVSTTHQKSITICSKFIDMWREKMTNWAQMSVDVVTIVKLHLQYVVIGLRASYKIQFSILPIIMVLRE